ncbi:hypothetical protein CEE96_12325, partial [Lactobacillus crispatus]
MVVVVDIQRNGVRAGETAVAVVVQRCQRGVELRDRAGERNAVAAVVGGTGKAGGVEDQRAVVGRDRCGFIAACGIDVADREPRYREVGVRERGADRRIRRHGRGWRIVDRGDGLGCVRRTGIVTAIGGAAIVLCGHGIRAHRGIG